MSVRTLPHHHRQASRTVPDILVALLCDRHAAALYRLALALVGDPDLAEQAVVDVLAAAVHTRTTATHAISLRRLTEERRELIEAVHHRCQRPPHDHLSSVEPREDTIAAIGLDLDTSDRPPHPHALTTPARAGAPALGRLSDRHPAPTDRGTTRRAVHATRSPRRPGG